MVTMSTRVEYDEDYIMCASYDSLMLNEDQTLDDFVVFGENDQVFEIEKGTGQRSIFIDKLITYFQEIEEYEKCAKLVTLKEKIIEYGN